MTGRERDEVLVRAARAGDRTAFDRLYAAHGRLVHGILLARVRAQDVDDLVQEVFLSAFEKLDSLRDPGRFSSWLAMIARTRAIDHLRARAPDADESDPDELGTGDPDRIEALEALAAIRELPEAYRETLVLRLVESMTGPEIAERTGLTPESVRVNLSRGLALLREKLGGVR